MREGEEMKVVEEKKEGRMVERGRGNESVGGRKLPIVRRR